MPDRVDLPFIAETVWAFDGSQWQPSTVELKGADVTPKAGAWDYDAWGANWWAWQVLIAFTGTSWRTMANAPANLSSPPAQAEFNRLIEAAEDERADALGEIITQHAAYDDIAACFMSLLRMTPATHPETFRLLQIAGLVGLFVSMHWKMKSKRPRPSEVLPALKPSVPVPGHPSYPSGHATQAYLMALVVQEAMIKPGTTPDTTLRDKWKPLLDTLAWRIGRNREIAGMHYASDSAAGAKLASATLAILMHATMDNIGTGGSPFLMTLTKAQGEW
jgi:hypothetical protein